MNKKGFGQLMILGILGVLILLGFIFANSGWLAFIGCRECAITNSVDLASGKCENMHFETYPRDALDSNTRTMFSNVFVTTHPADGQTYSNVVLKFGDLQASKGNLEPTGFNDYLFIKTGIQPLPYTDNNLGINIAPYVNERLIFDGENIGRADINACVTYDQEIPVKTGTIRVDVGVPREVLTYDGKTLQTATPTPSTSPVTPAEDYEGTLITSEEPPSKGFDLWEWLKSLFKNFTWT